MKNIKHMMMLALFCLGSLSAKASFSSDAFLEVFDAHMKAAVKDDLVEKVEENLTNKFNIEREVNPTAKAVVNWMGDSGGFDGLRGDKEMYNGSFLHFACSHGSRKSVKAMLEFSYPDPTLISRIIETKDAFGQTPLVIASKVGDIEIIELLISAGAKLESDDIEDETPLSAACAKGKTESAKVLLESGADPFHDLSYYGYPIQIAAEAGATDIVELLLKYGADANAFCDEDSHPYSHATDDPQPLVHAFNLRNMKMVEILLEFGANPHVVEQHPGGIGFPQNLVTTDGIDAVIRKFIEKGFCPHKKLAILKDHSLFDVFGMDPSKGILLDSFASVD